MLREGDILAGRFRIERIFVGRGCAPLVRAWDTLLEQTVAVFFPPHREGEDTLTRLSRTARAAAEINSDHMLRLFHVGTLDTGEPYSVLEWLVGSDLGVWLRRKGALPIKQAVDFVIQACDALAEAHSRGIVHRNIKPGYLFAAERPDVEASVKVLGWDLSTTLRSASAKQAISDAESRSDPPEATLSGTPLYMSPEQLRGTRDADERTDIWAVGITLCRLVTGHAPFMANSAAGIVSAIVSGKRLRERFPRLPAGLEAVILQCLETDRAKRYPNVPELAGALLDFGSDRAKPLVERIRTLPQRGSSRRPEDGAQ